MISKEDEKLIWESVNQIIAEKWSRNKVVAFIVKSMEHIERQTKQQKEIDPKIFISMKAASIVLAEFNKIKKL